MRKPGETGIACSPSSPPNGEKEGLAPGLSDVLDALTQYREREVVLLADVRRRHAQRAAATRPHPVYPVGPDAA